MAVVGIIRSALFTSLSESGIPHHLSPQLKGYMKTPEDIDAFLNGLLKESAEVSDEASSVSSSDRRYSAVDRRILNRMIEATVKQPLSVGVFVLLHEDQRLEYMIMNGDRIDATGVVSQFIQRQTEILAKERKA